MALRYDSPSSLKSAARGMSSFYEKRDQLGPAILYLKVAVNASQQIRTGAKGLQQELQSSLTKSLENPYRALARLLVRQGRLAEAEQVLAMLKEQEQFEFVRRDLASDPRQTRASLSPKEQDLIMRLRENAQALTGVYTDLETVEKDEPSTTDGDSKREQLRERLAKESERFDRLFKEVEHELAEQDRHNQGRDLAVLSQSSGTVSEALAELHESTGSRPAVVHLLPLDNTTIFIVTTKDGRFSIQGGLGEQHLNDLIAELREAIVRRDSSYRVIASQLYNALITPIEPQLTTAKVDTLMLDLIGTLRYLPFAALYDSAVEKHLIEKYRLTMYTATAQANLRDHPTPTWTAVALGVSKAHAGFTPLPAVVQELQGVVREGQDRVPAGILMGRRYLDETFSRQELLGLLDGAKRFTVIHVATHFKLTAGSEEESSLLLGNGEHLSLQNIRTDQGIKLRGYELVTLSACETAMGSGARGVEVEGLAVTLQRKGAKSVLATLWNVQDEGTARFMEQFYGSRGEKQKMTKAEALQQAQVRMLRGQVKTDNPKIDLTHPYYWAPFVLMGNWL